MNANAIKVTPRFLWFIMLSYSMVLVMANWFDARLIHLFGLNTDAGTIIFPLTFLLSDLMTEVYGYKHARRAIWAALMFNLLFLAYGQMIIHLPSPSYALHNNQEFDRLFGMNIRIVIASTLSYLAAEPLNSYVMAKLKISSKGRYMGMRFIASTWVASAVDSTVFTVVAFYSLMNSWEMFYFIITMWFIKVFVEVIGLPISTYLARKLKRAEGLDIYDKRTNFNFFRWEAEYSQEDNFSSHSK